MKKILLITAAILAFTASAQATIILDPPVTEALLGYTTSPEGITIQVKSGGCTGKGSFDVVIMESFPAQLAFERISPIMCLIHIEHGVKLFYSYEELNLKNDIFFLVNKIKRGVIHSSSGHTTEIK